MNVFQRLKTTLAPVILLLLACVIAARAQTPESKPPTKAGGCLVYIGTYSETKSKGIYAYHLDLASGSLTSLGLAGETASPSFLAIHPNRRFLYAANEAGSGGKSGMVSAFSIDATSGKLSLLNQQPSEGSGPCHLVVDSTGKAVLVANYGSGSIAVLPIKEDGRLGPASAAIQHKGSSVDAQRQEGPHAHCILTDPANRFALACDLGLDKVLVYRFDAAKGSLVPNDPASASVKPGAGSRHLAFHPNGRFVYVINEIQCTMTAFGYDAGRGELKELQTISTLPAGEELKGSYSTAEVEAHPNGHFLYGSNRGHNTIVVYAIDPKTGQLALVEHQSTRGRIPRNFGIDPTGTWLLAANQDSDTVVVFRIDAKSGRLTPTGNSVQVAAPVCVKFVPLN